MIKKSLFISTLLFFSILSNSSFSADNNYIDISKQGYSQTGLKKALKIVDPKKQYGFILKGGILRIKKDIVIPSNIVLDIMPNSKFKIDKDVTLTILGTIKNTMKQIFSGEGNVYFPKSIGTIYPEWWGAKGDNKTICSYAIEKALASVSDEIGGLVYFSPGIYLVDYGFEPKARTVIAGAGRMTSQIRIVANAPRHSFAKTRQTLFYINGTPAVDSEFPMRYVHFRDIRLDGNDNNNPKTSFNGIRFRRAIYCFIENAEVVMFQADGVILDKLPDEEGNISIVISDNIIRDNNSDGIVINGASNIEIINNIIRTGSGSGIEFEGFSSQRVKINNNQFNQTGRAAIECTDSDGTKELQIVGNLFYGNCPEDKERGAIHATGVKSWNIDGNFFTKCSGHGIYLDCNFAKITNNYFQHISKSAITAKKGARLMHIANNYIFNVSQEKDSKYDAMFIAAASSSILGNVIKTEGNRFQRYGLYLADGSNNSVVANNILTDSGRLGNIKYEPQSINFINNVGTK
jgi:hypothetical protein